MKPVFIITLLLSLPFLFSCQSNSESVNYAKLTVNSLYLDNQFTQPSSFSIESKEDIFMLDREMITMVEEKLKRSYSDEKKAKLLLEHIFSQDNIALSYLSNANVTAREAFHSKTANCMSLTIMAYALAKKADLNVVFQEVEIPEYWVRNGQYNLLTGHINLLVKTKRNVIKTNIYGDSILQIDFDPYVLKTSFSKKVINQNTVLAMFYNNKGGQALVNENYIIAYQYLKAATQTDKFLSSAWGNLAVLYRLTEHEKMAEATYRHAIALEKDNYTALANLAILLRKNLAITEAETIEKTLQAKRNKNPYYHALLADEAYYNNNYIQAVSHYKKAIKLNHKIHEFYFGLAKVYYQMNKMSAAKKAMRTALRLNKIKSIEKQYIAKLNFLKSRHFD
jgi:tetratricopeptide (TPR) repeat protein